MFFCITNQLFDRMVGLEDLQNKPCKNQFYDWFCGLTAHQVDSGFEPRTLWLRVLPSYPLDHQDIGTVIQWK